MIVRSFFTDIYIRSTSVFYQNVYGTFLINFVINIIFSGNVMQQLSWVSYTHMSHNEFYDRVYVIAIVTREVQGQKLPDTFATVAYNVHSVFAIK